MLVLNMFAKSDRIVLIITNISINNVILHNVKLNQHIKLFQK